MEGNHLDKNGITMTVNDEDLSPYLVINKLSRPSYDVDNETAEMTNDGAKITQSRRNQTTISADVTLASDPENNDMTVIEIDELIKSKLNTKGDLRIVFSDVPDRYFIGRLEGNSELEIMTPGIATLSLTFMIPDGKSHALENKTFEITETEDNERIFHIVNNGTAPARVVFDLKSSRDIDNFALIAGDEENEQLIQIGDESQPEIEGLPAQERKWRTDLMPSDKKNWLENEGVPNQNRGQDNASVVDGTLEWANPAGLVRPKDHGKTGGENDPNFWHGPTLSRYINDEIEDFKIMSKIIFRPTPKGVRGKKLVKQEGIFEINVYDEDNQLVIGFHMRDFTITSNLVWYRVYLGGRLAYENKMPRKYHSEDGGFGGQVRIMKFGNHFDVDITKQIGKKQTWHKELNFANEQSARLKAHRVDYWMGQYAARPVLNQQLAYSFFYKVNAEDENDIPVHIEFDDEFLIDGEEGKTYVNGQLVSSDYFKVGSSYIEVPPGETDIYLVGDEGAITGTASIREVYL